NGSTTYNESDSACEPLEATKLSSSTATEIHSGSSVGETIPSVVTSAPIGSTVHDKATVTGTVAGGTPTGNVTFTVWLGNTSCTGTGAAAGTVSLNASGVAHPSDDETVPVGGLSFKAHYNGSTTYNESDSACEPLEATKLSSSTATEIHSGSSVGETIPSVVTSAPIGSTVHDKATVTGTVAG